jgi:hypothetical protein
MARRKRSDELALISADLHGRIRWSRGLLVRTHKGTCSKWPQSACKTRGARRPIEKKKKKSKAMTEARRNERAKCAAKVKERSGTTSSAHNRF